MRKILSTNIGINTRIWDFTIVCEKAIIGNNCNICSFCFIENDVFIGDNVTIKTHNSIWDGVTIENNVFIGQGVRFCNDKFPRSNNIHKSKFKPEKIKIQTNTSVGSGTIILPGITIGSNVLIGAGSIITKDVPSDIKIIGKY